MVHTAAGADGDWLTTDDTIATNPESAYGNPYMFTARRYDEESGNYYYRARMYSPDLGRFLQPDPIGYYDSMNFYQYCGNNPMNWIDPYGLIKCRNGNYCGPDYSGGVHFPYTSPNGNVYNNVDEVPDDVWEEMQRNNPSKDSRDEAYRQHDNAYRTAGMKYGRNSKEFRDAKKKADKKLADDLWNTARTKDPIDDLFNGLFTGGFKLKAGLGL